MSSIHGKKNTVFRKKKTSTKLSSSPTFTQDYKFAHQTSAGDTTINLDSLNLPVQMTEFTNPTGTELAKINLKSNANSLVLVSSIGKTLICDVDYKINTSRIIELQYEAAENEIFTGQIRATQATNNLLDGETYVCTGTLLAGQQNIALGKAFTLNANPSKQIGDMVLYIDGAQQFRNIGNATAAPLADGNYEELDAGDSLTIALKMNEAYAEDVSWAVVSTGVIVDNSNISNQQQLDALAGQIDSMVPTLADVAGVPESTFQSNPNNVDLKAFGDKLFTTCAKADSNEANLVILNKILDLEVYDQMQELRVSQRTDQMLERNLELQLNLAANLNTYKNTVSDGFELENDAPNTRTKIKINKSGVYTIDITFYGPASYTAALGLNGTEYLAVGTQDVSTTNKHVTFTGYLNEDDYVTFGLCDGVADTSLSWISGATSATQGCWVRVTGEYKKKISELI